MILDKLLVPTLGFRLIISLADPKIELEVCKSELTVHFHEGFAHVEPELCVHTWHRYEEYELEVILELVHLFWHTFGLEVFEVGTE